MSHRIAAEWEHQNAIWLSWPHHAVHWGDRLPLIRDFYCEWIATCLQHQDVCLVLPYAQVHTFSPEPFSNAPHTLHIYHADTNDIWIRDYGPFFLYPTIQEQSQTSCPKIFSYQFNSWGAKFPPWDNDNAVPHYISKQLQLAYHKSDLIMEGGALEFNGNGLAITTAPCLIGANRNEGSIEQICDALCQDLFLQDVIVLPQGLADDHTDGHIDNLARFVNETTILLCQTDDPNSPHYQACKQAYKILSTYTHPILCPDGFTIIDLPIPPRACVNAEYLPRSYANFIFLNGAVIIPLFGEKQDQEVLTLFKTLLPERKVYGKDCSLIIQEGGALHCASHQQ
jgi:agmatine deiminase